MNRHVFLILSIIWALSFSLYGSDGILDMSIASDNWVEAEHSSDTRVFTETAPPPGPVRPVAEWEPASRVLIRYPLGIPTALVVHLANTTPVVCIVANSSTQTQATNAFSSAGVNMANVSFMMAQTDSYWTRDYGPWFNVNGLNQVGIVDFPYNRPRPNDDEIPRTFATQYSYPLYGMNVTNTGGNYMTDGIFTGAQTDLVYTENTGQTQAQVGTKMLNYLGITDFNAIPDPNNTYIDHIDCWGKFLAPDKVLIRSVPTSHAQYDEIEAAAAFFASHNCAWGYPYKVYRVYTPQNQPYTNSVILNNKVFVPIMNNANDAAALQAYRTALPGYEVIGITGASSTPWESTDALHCRVHEIADKEMLNIAHSPYFGMVNTGYDGSLSVNILALSSTSLYSDSTFVSYKVNQGVWQRIALTSTGGTAYNGHFPTTFVAGDTIRYFIHTADLSGRSLNHPYTAALDPHKFWFAPDTQAPIIQHTSLDVINQSMLPITISANVTDNNLISSVSLTYRINEGEPIVVNMATPVEFVYAAEINPVLPENGGHLYYWITATDIANNVATAPAEGWYDVTTLPTSTDDATAPVCVSRINLISPNPFSKNAHGSISIQYSAKALEPVSFDIFNLKGQLVKHASAIVSSAGQHTLNWNGRDNYGNPVRPGVYFVKMHSRTGSNTKKLLILE